MRRYKLERHPGPYWRWRLRSIKGKCEPGTWAVNGPSLYGLARNVLRHKRAGLI